MSAPGAPDPPREPELLERDLAPDPIEQFRRWYAEAEATGAPEPDAMALATADSSGAPSVRFVLLRGVDSRGFRFFTSYQSRKGRELAENPRGAIAIYWNALGRQVRAEGAVGRLPKEESDAYFHSRPPGSRISAIVSPQSSVIPERAELARRAEELVALSRHAHDRLERPAEWGGYVLRPDAVEFWVSRRHRLHDRLRYRRERSGWRIERLAP